METKTLDRISGLQDLLGIVIVFAGRETNQYLV
jgi:hypothetical protein